jgi:gluconate 5-dehydrogenase
MKDVLVITGVGKGFGRALFEHFVSTFHVIGITRSSLDCDEIKKNQYGKNNSFDLIVTDITNYINLETLLKPLLESKKSSIYGIINNAGVRFRKSLVELTIDEMKSVSEVNLFAPIFISKMLIPYFIDNGRGRIINISSILSESALPDLSAYAVSKAGLDGFTRSVTAEYASHNITSNSILPGFCKTSYFDKFKENNDLYEMTITNTPAKRWGESNELIGICSLLLSDDGGYINGASIPVDGGWTAC